MGRLGWLDLSNELREGDVVVLAQSDEDTLDSIPLMGYPYKCGKAKMPGWKQRNRKFVQRLVLITQETTLTFSAGFLMMLPALITLTGCVGRLVFRAQHVRAGRGGA